MQLGESPFVDVRDSIKAQVYLKAQHSQYCGVLYLSTNDSLILWWDRSETRAFVSVDATLHRMIKVWASFLWVGGGFCPWRRQQPWGMSLRPPHAAAWKGPEHYAWQFFFISKFKLQIIYLTCIDTKFKNVPPKQENLKISILLQFTVAREENKTQNL